QLDGVGDPLQEAGRAVAVGAHAALHARGHAPLGPGEDARGDGGEVDHHEGEEPHEGEVDELRPRPGGGVVAGVEVPPAGVANQAVDPTLHYRSISGATTSKDAISATRSAIISPRESASMMPMAVKLPVRIFTR